MRRIKIAIIGLGNRGFYTYASIAFKYSDIFELVAVAEPLVSRREKFIEEYNFPSNQVFDDWKELLEKDLNLDGVIIATGDKYHVEPAIEFVKKGYNILLEKPIATDMKSLNHIKKELKGLKKVILVAHVLRYTPYFRKLKEIIENGIIGEIKGIDHQEHVGYFHFAHSYVRGNWRNTKETAPSILTKSCHDLDIMLWLVNSSYKEIFAFGDLTYFKKENQPMDASDRCLNCKYQDECVYSAKKIYLSEYTGWPVNAISEDLSYESRYEAIKGGPYGRCVFSCDNDVCDYYSVSMKFENGVLGTFTMSGFTHKITRKTRVFGTLGELEGDLARGEIYIKKFDKEVEKITIPKFEGHSGGDENIMKHFYKAVLGLENPLTTLEVSLESHFVAFAVEESRRTKKSISIKEFLNKGLDNTF